MGINFLPSPSQWDSIKRSIKELVYSIFNNPQRISEINDTNIVLIPKNYNLEPLKEFRLISLYNVIYKLITKILANKLKPHLNHLISPNQCSFIRSQHSMDNVIVAQEVIHLMRNKKGMKSWMLLDTLLRHCYFNKAAE